ncbi:MAG: O-linked N-acetylglucosamine transferase, SPINDLY family protein, partial [Sphaerospermopsis kisseleviana]
MHHLESLKKQAYTNFQIGEYFQSSTLYQELVTLQPENKEYQWYYGLSLLLSGNEAEAQTTWMLAVFDGEEAEIEQCTCELIQVLKKEAERLEELQSYQLAWVIRQHLREISPEDVNNILQLIKLSLELGNLTEENFRDLGIVEILNSARNEFIVEEINRELLFQVLQKTLKSICFEPWILEFPRACIPYLDNLQLTNTLMLTATEVAYTGHRFNLAIKYAELAVEIQYPNAAVISEVL